MMISAPMVMQIRMDLTMDMKTAAGRLQDDDEFDEEPEDEEWEEEEEEGGEQPRKSSSFTRSQITLAKRWASVQTGQGVDENRKGLQAAKTGPCDASLLKSTAFRLRMACSPSRKVHVKSLLTYPSPAEEQRSLKYEDPGHSELVIRRGSSSI